MYKQPSADGLGVALGTSTRMDAPFNFAIFSLDGQRLSDTEKVALVIIRPRKLKDILSQPSMDGNVREEKIKTEFATSFLLFSRKDASTTFSYISEILQDGLIDGSAIEVYRYNTKREMVTDAVVNLKINPQFLSYGLGLKSIDDLLDPDAGSSIKIGNVILAYPQNIRESRLEPIVKLVRKSSDLLNKHGLTELARGNMVVMDLPTGRLGLYYPTERIMKISPKSKYGAVALETILHEYGHKLYYEFLGSDARNAIASMYRTALREGSRKKTSLDARIELTTKILNDLGLAVGDTIEYKGRKRDFKRFSPFVVSEYEGRKLVLSSEADPVISFEADPAFLSTDKFEFNGVNLELSKTDILEKSFDPDGWFPTDYSRKDHEEWFSEIFSGYIAGKIRSKEVIDFINEIIDML